MRRIFGYGVAVAVTPYLLVKVIWVVGALIGALPPGKGMSTAGFVALNLVTIAMAAVGIALGLVLGRRDVRGTARPVLVFAWLACGFLVPMIPYLTLGFFTGDDPGWEQLLIQASFLALACCLVVAVPLYLAEHRPSAYTGRPRPALVAVAVAGAVVAGSISVYWAAGGEFGLTHPGQRDAGWHLLAANSGLWALAGAWAVTRPGRTAAAVAWLSSGLLFAWSFWKLPFTLIVHLAADPDVRWPENLAVAAGLYVFSIAAGLTMVTALVHRAATGGHRPASTGR
ncbi:hypothetical protein ACWKSP_35635 [Micromonosporaceae bacterium Da 78-11]